MDSYNQHFALNILHPSARNLSTGGAFQSLLDNFVTSKNQLSNNWKLVLIGHKFLCNSLQGLILINLFTTSLAYNRYLNESWWRGKKEEGNIKFIKQVQKNGGSCCGTPLALIWLTKRWTSAVEIERRSFCCLKRLLVKRKRYFGLSKYLNEAFVGLQVEKLEWVIGLKASIRIVARISKCYFIQLATPRLQIIELL